jgi:hypothetical protein
VNHVTGGHVAEVFRPLPKERHDHEDEGIDNNGVGQREETVGANRIDQRRNSDDRVGGVEVAADQKPSDPDAEAAATKAPLVDMGKRLRPSPLVATNPITVTSTKKKTKTASAVVLSSVVIAHAPVGDPGQESGNRHPGELIPVEEWETEENRVVKVVEGNPKEPDIGNDEQPAGCCSKPFIHLMIAFRCLGAQRIRV